VRELIPHKVKDFVGTPGSLPNRRFGRVEAEGGISPSPFKGEGITCPPFYNRSYYVWLKTMKGESILVKTG
jgi:hypothetical protein